MKRSKKKKIKIANYPRFLITIALLLIIVFCVIKLFSLSSNQNKEISTIKEEDNSYEISLEGDETVYLYKNEKYIEPGYSAKNSKGNDITDKVKVENKVNIAKAGEYNLNYFVDTNGIMKTRKVIVKEPILLEKGEKATGSVPVLMYHYFYSKKAGEKGKNNNWMEITKFEEQLKYLKKNNYYFPTWEELEKYVNNEIDLPKKSVIITMDDGQKSLYQYAIPLLDKYKIPATAFIITKNFDTKNLEKYKKSTICFESHTDNMHRAGGNIGHGGIFPALPIKDSVEDLKTSIQKLNGNNNAIAYPYGDCTETTQKAVKQVGFKVAFTTVYGKVKPSMNQYALPRVRMTADMSLDQFAGSL